MKRNKLSRTGLVIVFATLIVALVFGRAEAQYGDSYTRMLNTTMVASQSLFRAQTAVNQQRSNMARAAGQSSANTGTAQQQPMRQYPITATDFQALSAPIVPDQLANSATGVEPQAREQMRQYFLQVLSNFNSAARKNNMANAFAFITGVALQIKTGKEVNEAKTDQLIAYFNNTIAAAPEYYTLTPYKQQVLYESLIITGGIIALLETQGKQTNNQQALTQAKQMSDTVLKTFLGMQ